MTCPTCNGALAMLFTSTYCPRCEAREPERPGAAKPATAAPAMVDGSLFVGSDGELWTWKSGIAWRITTNSNFGPVIAFRMITDARSHRDIVLITRRATSGLLLNEIVDAPPQCHRAASWPTTRTPSVSTPTARTAASRGGLWPPVDGNDE